MGWLQRRLVLRKQLSQESCFLNTWTRLDGRSWWQQACYHQPRPSHHFFALLVCDPTAWPCPTHVLPLPHASVLRERHSGVRPGRGQDFVIHQGRGRGVHCDTPGRGVCAAVPARPAAGKPACCCSTESWASSATTCAPACSLHQGGCQPRDFDACYCSGLRSP